MSNTPSRHAARCTAGFTLVELLITTAIVGILAATAIPSFSALLERQRLSSAVLDLQLALEEARSEAITTGLRTAIAARGEDWRAGWQVFYDGNGNGQPDDGERVLRQSAPVHESVSFAPHFGAGSTGTSFSFTADGFIRRPSSNGLVMGSLAVRAGDQCRTLVFAIARVRTTPAATCAAE